MKGIIYVSNSRFKKFYIYQGPNTQIFKGKDNGIVEAKRER